MRKIFPDQTETNQLFNQDDNRATKEDINQLSVRIDETVQALDNLAENLAIYKDQMAASVDTNQLNAVSAAIQTLTSTAAQISNLTVANQEVTVKAIIESLEANLADIKALVSESADVVSLLADSATIDEATITTLNATTANITNWVLQNISAQSIITNSATFGSATIGGLRVDGNSFITGNQTVSGNIVVSGDASVAGDITAESIATAEASIENMHWDGSTVITNTPDSFIVAVPHFENGQYYVQLINEDSSYATIEIFNSIDNYFVRWSQPTPGVISNIYKDGVNENAVIYIEIENPDELPLTIKYASTCATENVQGPATYTEMPVEPLVVYPVTYKDGSKFFKNVDLAQQGSTVGTLRQLDSSNIEDATDNIVYDTTEDATIIVYKPDQQLNTTDDVAFHEVDTTFLGVRDFHTRNFIATEMKTLSTIDLTNFDDGSIIVVRIGSTSETNMPSAAYIKETINGSPVLFDIVKTRNMPIVASNKPLIWDPTTHSIIEATDLVVGKLDVETDVKIGNDLFVDNNVVISGDLEVRGTTFSSEVENVQADGDWIVLRANNPNSLANGSYAGFVFHNYNSLGKDAAITLDNTGTFRVSTQTTESVSPLANTWLVDEQYFYGNVDFSQATLLDENYPVTRFAEVFTDIEAYKDSNDDHYFYDPNVETIEYHDNVVYNTVTQKVELAGNVVSFTPDPSVDTPHEVHFYTSISFMEPQASDMEAIATRDETSEWDNNEIPMYDTTAERFVGIGAPTQNNTVLTAQVDSTTGAVSYIWKSGGGAGGLAFVGTRAEYEVARLIPEGTDGYIPSGAMVVITDENDYIEGDEQ